MVRWEKKLDEIGSRLKNKEVRIPTEMLGAAVFMIFAIVMLLIMPQQVAVSESDVVDGRMFPSMLMLIIIVCCAVLLLQGFIKIKRKEALQICTVNMLTEVKALIILAILAGTYVICKWTDLFVTGAVFCVLGFLIFFRCKKKLYYVITIGLAALIWVAFRFGLGVSF